MKHSGLCALLMALSFAACKKGDTNSGAYNGFKVDGVVYQLDSIEHTFGTSLRPLKIHSKDNGGAAIYIHTMPDSFPEADGTYQFDVQAVRHDSLDVDVCFETDDHQTEYCAIEDRSGQALTKLTIKIAGDKWTVTLPPTIIFNNTSKTLEMAASE